METINKKELTGKSCQLDKINTGILIFFLYTIFH